MTTHISNWKRNLLVFKFDSVLYEFYLPIATWIFIWTPLFTFTQMTRALTIGMLASILLEVPSGALADIIGRKRTVILSRILYFISYCILFFNHTYTWFLAWMILYQISIALESGAQSALVYDSLKENNQESHYEKAESDKNMFTKVGVAIAGIIGGYLYTKSPFLAYDCMIIITGINVMISFFYQEPKLDSEKISVKNYIRQNVKGVHHIFAHPIIRMIAILSILLYGISWLGVWFVYEPRLFEAGFTPQQMTWIVAGSYLLHAAGTRLTQINSKFKPNLPIFLTISQALTTLISFFAGRITAIASIYSRKVTDGWIIPSMLNYQNQYIELKYRATSLSAISLFANLLVALSGLWIGPALDTIGAAKTMGILGIFSVVLVTPIAIFTVKTIDHYQV